MNKKINLWMLGITAMLASCSQNELTDTGTEREATAVFTVSMDGRVNTRATDNTDKTPTRCLMEVYNADGVLQGNKQYEGTSTNGTFTFTTERLEKEQKYTFVFWADEGNDTYNTASLTGITPATDGDPGIAFSGKVEQIPDGTNTDVTLTHAVAKLVLNQQDNSPLGIGDEAGILFSVPRYAYDALNDKYEAVENEEAITLGNDAIEITDGNQSGMLFSAYALVPGGAEAEQVNVILSYLKQGTQLGIKTLAVPNVPLKRNFRTVLSGDLGRIYTGVAQAFNATLDTDWEDDMSQAIKPNEIGSGSIHVLAPGTLTTEQIETALTTEANSSLTLTGTINLADFVLLSTYAGTPSLTSLDLSGTEGLTEASNPGSYSQKTFTTVKTLRLPQSCKTIGQYTFVNSAIEAFDGGGVQTVGRGGFYECKALHTVNLPCATKLDTRFIQYGADVSILPLTTLKLTAAGNIELESNWMSYSAINTALVLNPDKQEGGDGTPKPSGNTWENKNFKGITYETPAPLPTE